MLLLDPSFVLAWYKSLMLSLRQQKDPSMTPDEFKRRQLALGWTNAKMASHLRKTPQSISNYRNERQKIPEHVDVLLDAAINKLREAPVTKSLLAVNLDLGKKR